MEIFETNPETGKGYGNIQIYKVDLKGRNGGIKGKLRSHISESKTAFLHL